jgi:hypothetical protein
MAIVRPARCVENERHEDRQHDVADEEGQEAPFGFAGAQVARKNKGCELLIPPKLSDQQDAGCLHALLKGYRPRRSGKPVEADFGFPGSNRLCGPAVLFSGRASFRASVFDLSQGPDNQQ